MSGHIHGSITREKGLATMGRISRETVLRSVQQLYLQDDHSQRAPFYKLLHAAEEDPPACCKSTNKQQISGPRQGVIDRISSPSNAAESGTGLKRKLGDTSNNYVLPKKQKSQEVKLEPFTCSQCGKPCTGTTDRENGSCLHHKGTLEVDHNGDVWANEDGFVHGKIDTAKRRREYPGACYWTCCGSPGTSRGCVISSLGNVGRSHLARLRAAGFPH